jgi:hypothetical protein
MHAALEGWNGDRLVRARRYGDDNGVDVFEQRREAMESADLELARNFIEALGTRVVDAYQLGVWNGFENAGVVEAEASDADDTDAYVVHSRPLLTSNRDAAFADCNELEQRVELR